MKVTRRFQLNEFETTPRYQLSVDGVAAGGNDFLGVEESLGDRTVDASGEVGRALVRVLARDGTPLADAQVLSEIPTGAASVMFTMRSRRTDGRVTSTPHFSQVMPLKRMFLYLPQ